MSSVKVLGVTGGLASGKTTVLRMFAGLGARILSSDEIARDIVVPGSGAWAEIRRAFGDRVLTPSGQLDRGQLRRIVFEDPASRVKLEQITHPPILAALETRISGLVKEGATPLIAVEIPLLFEVGERARALVDKVAVVYLGRDEQLRRGEKRIPRHQVVSIIGAQWPLDEKLSLSDLVIDNSATPGETRLQVGISWRMLTGVPQGSIPSPSSKPSASHITSGACTPGVCPMIPGEMPAKA